jgi:hypothetical protein
MVVFFYLHGLQNSLLMGEKGPNLITKQGALLPFYLKAKKKNYGNSNISPLKNIIFQKSSKKEAKNSFKIL